jgi:hypothetical protein
LKILRSLGSFQEPGEEASRLAEVKARRLAVGHFQGATADDLDGPDRDASGQSIHVDAELGDPIPGSY